jgi:hypothetical protein
MLVPTGSAAIHVLLMRVSHARDAFEVFGMTANTVYTNLDMRAHFRQTARALNSQTWQASTPQVRMALYPCILGAFARIFWALDIVEARLAVMDVQSDNETDTEA